MSTRRAPTWVHLLRSVAALAAVVCALALPFAPVLDEETTVRWSSAAAPATTALFVPYRAEELTAEVSCGAVRSALAGPGRTVLLATAPEAAPRNGLLLVAEAGSLRMLLDERDHPVPLPAGTNCAVVIASTRTGTAVTAGGEQVVRLGGDVVPEVFTFRSDAGAGGVTVTARTRNWFESTPTPLKTGLIIGYGVLLALAVATTAGSGRPTRAPSGRGERPAPRRAGVLVDLAVLVVLAAWLVIGPITDDDGFAAMIMRNGLASGDIGNYYRWFNASEAPFALVGHLVAPLTAVSLAPPVLRLPSLLAGVLSWFVISRGVLGAALPAAAGAVGVRLLAAVAFLAWWLPFDLGMRPESFVALGAATVLALLLRMRRCDPAAPRALHLVLAAALVAGLTVAMTPSGLLVAVPVLIALPAILRLVRSRGVAGGGAAVLLLTAAGAVGVVAMFADQTLDAVVRASVVHTEFGPAHGWYDERLRYDFLLNTEAMGSAAKRLPVLLTLALLPIAAVLLSRRLPGLADLRCSALLTGAAAGGFAVLWVTPSKWSHHFGALVGFAVPFLVAAVLVTLRAARRHSGDRVVLGVCLAATAAVAVVTALAFSGPNTWWLYSDYGMSWSDEPVRPLGIPLNNPLTWLVAALAAAAVAVALHRRGGRDLRAAGACTGGVLPIAAMAASVALLLGSFAAAPVRLSGTYTLAAQNLESIRATSCGLQDHVQVLPEIPGGVLRPAVGSTAARGFVPGGGFRPDRPPPSASGATRYSWGSRSAGPGATGKLTTAWFPLPELAADQEVAVRLSGRPEQGNTLALEFARRDGEAPEVLGDRRLVDPAPTDRPFDDPVRGRDEDWRDYSDWRSLAVPAGSVPAGADLVRVRAVDGSTDEQGWLAVSGPAVREVVGLTDFLARRGPVLIAWPMSFAFPCRTDFPVVRGGLAQTPGVILGAPRSYPEPDLSYDPEIGGTFAGVRLQSGLVEVPSRLAGRPGDDWGQVLLVAYRGVRDDYQVETTRERRAGWEGEGDYPFD